MGITLRSCSYFGRYCIITALFSSLVTLAIASPVSAQTLSLSWPVACQFGKDCTIQNYVDNDTTATARDFTCGPLTYDGHKGTDIRLFNDVAMRKGVNVLAAADGVVRGVRDGVADVNINVIGKDAVKNRECGNGVVINHATGFETQYCHLMKGSIAVKQGQPVKAGDVLGRIGMSGFTEFPHLHFEVRRLGKVIDPYNAQPMGTTCGTAIGGNGLWNPSLANRIPYTPTMLLGQGFTTAPAKAETVRAQPTSPSVISRNSPAVIYWADMMGTRVGDVLKLTITGPNGNVWVTRDVPYTRNQAVAFSFVGKKATPEGLIPGTYSAKTSLTRKGQDYLLNMAELTLEVQ